MLWPHIKLRALALPAAATLLVAPGAAGQQAPAPPGPRPLVVRFWPDAAIAATGLGAFAIPRLLFTDSVPSPCPCASTRVPAFDRMAIGPINRRAAWISDAGLVGTMSAGVVALALARPGSSGRDRGEDVALLAQSVMITAGLTQILKTATARPRPFLYGGYTEPSAMVARDDVESFPSGHASVSFAAAAGYWSVLQRRGAAGAHTAEIATLFGMAAATGALRVVAHKHFPTDAVAGAVLGAVVGWAGASVR